MDGKGQANKAGGEWSSIFESHRPGRGAERGDHRTEPQVAWERVIKRARSTKPSKRRQYYTSYREGKMDIADERKRRTAGSRREH